MAFHTTDGRYAECFAKKNYLDAKNLHAVKGIFDKYLEERSIMGYLTDKPYQLQEVLKVICVAQESIRGKTVHIHLLCFYSSLHTYFGQASKIG